MSVPCVVESVHYALDPLSFQFPIIGPRLLYKCPFVMVCRVCDVLFVPCVPTNRLLTWANDVGRPWGDEKTLRVTQESLAEAVAVFRRCSWDAPASLGAFLAGVFRPVFASDVGFAGVGRGKM